MSSGDLRVTDIHLAYRGQAVLDGLRLDIEPGQYACLLGRSGSGKSTLLGTVAGFTSADHGRIEIGGHTVFDAAARTSVPPQARGIGMVFQEATLWPHLSVHENILFPLHSRGRRAPRKQADALLDRVGLSGMGRRRPGELSGGQRQRVAICRALIAEPSLILLDEPLSALDSLLREELRDYLQLLIAERQTTALHVTHDPAEAFALGHRVGVLDHGRLVQWGRPQDLYDHPASEVVAGLTGTFHCIDVTAARIDRYRARFTFDERQWVSPAHESLIDGKARLLLRPEAVRCLPWSSVGSGPVWRIARRRFDSGRYRLDLVGPEGLRVEAISTRCLDDAELAIDFESERCWLLPAVATLPH